MSEFVLSEDVKTRLLKWSLSGDTGSSSETIACAAIGLAETDRRNGDFDVPYDTSDFGRCYRLLQAVPELRDAFPLVVKAYPKFGPVLDAWDELAALYVSDLEACYRRIKELVSPSASSTTWGGA